MSGTDAIRMIALCSFVYLSVAADNHRMEYQTAMLLAVGVLTLLPAAPLPAPAPLMSVEAGATVAGQGAKRFAEASKVVMFCSTDVVQSAQMVEAMLAPLRTAIEDAKSSQRPTQAHVAGLPPALPNPLVCAGGESLWMCECPADAQQTRQNLG